MMITKSVILQTRSRKQKSEHHKTKFFLSIFFHFLRNQTHPNTCYSEQHSLKKNKKKERVIKICYYMYWIFKIWQKNKFDSKSVIMYYLFKAYYELPPFFFVIYYIKKDQTVVLLPTKEITTERSRKVYLVAAEQQIYCAAQTTRITLVKSQIWLLLTAMNQCPLTTMPISSEISPSSRLRH